MNEKKRFFIKLFKSLSNDGRLDLLIELGSGERNVTELVKAVKQKQSSVSHNLSNLIASGLVHCRQDGAFRYYSLDAKLAMPIVKSIQYFPKPYLLEPTG